MDAIIRPLITEKAMAKIEKENTLCFIVSRKANKPTIKKQAEKLYNIKVTDVNTQISRSGEKVAYLRISKETVAMDIATKLGVV